MELIRNEALGHDTPMILKHIAPETPAADQKIPFPTFHEVFLCSPHKTCLLSVASFLPSFALSIPGQTSQTILLTVQISPYLLTKDPVGYYSNAPIPARLPHQMHSGKMQNWFLPDEWLFPAFAFGDPSYHSLPVEVRCQDSFPTAQCHDWSEQYTNSASAVTRQAFLYSADHTEKHSL